MPKTSNIPARAPVGTVTGDDGLSLAQRRFVEAYVETMNASEAARRAGYSVKTAGFQGSALLKRPQIREAVERLVFERAQLTRAEIVTELRDADGNRRFPF